MKKIIMFSDGGARGNPGPAGIGVVLLNDKKEVIEEISRYIGETTNNQAEYLALLAGLNKAVELKASEVECFLDSELVVKQLNKQYKVRDKNLAEQFVKVWNLLSNFKKISFKHIYREQNKEADRLVNEAIDRRNNT